MKSRSKSRGRFARFVSTAFSKKYRLVTFIAMFAVIGGAIYIGTSLAASTPVAYLRNGLSTGSADITFAFGDKDDVPVACNWDGKGPDGFGVRRPGNVRFYLSDTLTPTKVNKELAFGNQGDIPVCGDWNGDKKAGVGVFRPEDRTFYLTNEIKPGAKVTKIAFGQKGDIPLTCDWNGDGKTDIGVYRPSNAHFYLSYTKLGKVDYDIHYGNGGDQPVCGDWNGDKKAGIGIHRPSNSKFYLSNGSVPSTQGAGRTEKPASKNERRKWDVNYEFMYGNGGGQQVFAGDWNGDGKDSVAIYRMDTPPGWKAPTPPTPPAPKKTTYTCVGTTVKEVANREQCVALLTYAYAGYPDIIARQIAASDAANAGGQAKTTPIPPPPANPPPQPPAPDPAPTPVGTPTLQIGSQGAAVANLQARLAGRGFWIATTGNFDGATKSTVESFQKVRRISSDGIVGPQTWGQLGAAEAEGWRFNPNDPLLAPPQPVAPVATPPATPPPSPPPAVNKGTCWIMAGSYGTATYNTAQNFSQSDCALAAQIPPASAGIVSAKWHTRGMSASATVWAAPGNKGQCTVGNSTSTMTRAECWAFAAFFNRTDSAWYDSFYAFSGPKWSVYPYITRVN